MKKKWNEEVTNITSTVNECLVFSFRCFLFGMKCVILETNEYGRYLHRNLKSEIFCFWIFYLIFWRAKKKFGKIYSFFHLTERKLLSSTTKICCLFFFLSKWRWAPIFILLNSLWLINEILRKIKCNLR